MCFNSPFLLTAMYMLRFYSVFYFGFADERLINRNFDWLIGCRIKKIDLQESAFQDQRRKVKAYEIEISSLKDLHGSTNEKLLEELRNLRAECDNLRHHTGPHHQPSPDDTSDHDNKPADLSVESELRFMRSKSEDYPRSRSVSSTSNKSSPLSELPSSVFNRTVSVSESIHPPPLEKLLSMQMPSSARDIEQKRLAHLSELLHESESANVRLIDQIRVLKSELRRTEFNAERDKHANSMEYLKNVLMQFLTHRVAAQEQEKLIEVLIVLFSHTHTHTHTHLFYFLSDF